MLDFHLINHTVAKSIIDTGNFEHFGGLDYHDFKYLQNLNIIESWLDYYKDFRWTHDQVIQKYERLYKIISEKKYEKNNNKSPETFMLTILQKAKDANLGLIACAD